MTAEQQTYFTESDRVQRAYELMVDAVLYASQASIEAREMRETFGDPPPSMAA